MKRFTGSRPSPAMVIACIALFVSLGGVSYGVATGSIDSREIKNNNVRSTDLRNNDVRTRDLRNNDVRGGDVRNNTLSGSDILESSLGKVPSASSADNASNASNANRANSAGSVDKLKTVGSYKKVNSSASNDDPNLARSAASEVPLYSVGAFDVYGKCFTDANAPSTSAETYIRTNENGSIVYAATAAGLTGAAAYLDTSTVETQALLSTTTAANNSAAAWPPWVGDYFAAAPGGTGINGNSLTAAKHGTPAAGDGVYGPGNVCLFGGFGIG